MTEKKVSLIGYDGTIDGLANVQIGELSHSIEGIELREKNGSGAFIVFKRENPVDDWSFSFTVKVPRLSFSERAGVYLWYGTGVTRGDFKGVNRGAVGAMAGLEITGRAVQIVMASGDGSHDMSDGDVTVDSISHIDIAGMAEVSFKVIHTTKNIKIEIYDTNKRLVYDGLRFSNAKSWGDGSRGKKFIIATQYNNTSLTKLFVLRSASFSRRNESENYDPFEERSVPSRRVPRIHSEVAHSDSVVRHLISSIEHTIMYVRTLVGGPAGSKLIPAAEDIMKLAERTASTIEVLREKVLDTAAENLEGVVSDIQVRLEKVRGKLGGMGVGISDINTMSVALERRNIQTGTTSVVFASLIFLIILIRQIGEMRFKKSDARSN